MSIYEMYSVSSAGTIIVSNARGIARTTSTARTISTTISLGGDHIPAPVKEMDIADRNIERLVEIYEYLELRKIKGGGDHASDGKVLAWAGYRYERRW
jgi:hypothetical protein